MTRTPRTHPLSTLVLALVITLTFALPIGALASLTVLAGQGHAVPSPLARTEAPTACQEDDPCWDCATMGNGLCGPVDPTYVDPTLTTVSSCTWVASGDVTCTWWAPSVSE